MLTYTENYGEDIEGNREHLMMFWELEKDDEPYILEQIKEYQEGLDDDEELPDTIEVSFICPITEEMVYFDIKPRDFL